MTQLGSSPEWFRHAACAGDDGNVYYPEPVGLGRGTIPPDYRPALVVCRNVCRVRAECLDHALVNDERFGVWGGTTPEDRLRIRRRRDSVNDSVNGSVNDSRTQS